MGRIPGRCEDSLRILTTVIPDPRSSRGGWECEDSLGILTAVIP